MSIGNCDCCDRRNVPGSVFEQPRLVTLDDLAEMSGTVEDARS